MITEKDIAQILNELGITPEKFRVMMTLFLAQVNVAQAQGTLDIAEAQRVETERVARETVARAQNAVDDARNQMAALVGQVAKA